MIKETDDEILASEKKALIVKIIMALLLFILIFPGLFYAGAIISCNIGEGQLNGLTCVGYDMIGVCKHEGNIYQVIEVNGSSDDHSGA